MNYVQSGLRTLVMSSIPLLLASCASVAADDWVELTADPAGSGPAFHLTGAIHQLDLEGGLFVIRDAEGTQFNPTNLPVAFQTDGVAVEAQARRRDDVASIGMVGPIVDLLRIRKLPTK